MPDAVIAGANSERARNDSEYSHIISKWDSKPHWLEEIDGIRERFSHTDSQVVRTYKCPWSQRFVAQEWLLGYSYSEANPNPDPDAPKVYRIRRVLPAQDPERPWLFASEVELAKGEGAWVENPAAYVRDAQGKPSFDNAGRIRRTGAIAYVSNDQHGVAGLNPPVAGFGDLGDYQPPSYIFSDGVAILRATYRSRKYSVLSDDAMIAINAAANRSENFELTRYVERHIDYAVEAVPMAKWGANLKYTNAAPAVYAGQVIPEAGVKNNPTLTINYIWHEVPDPPYAAYFDIIGKINSREFDGFGGSFKYPFGTILCMPWKLERKEGLTGRVTWTIHYRFQYRPQGWNFFPAADGNFYRATFGGGANGETVYKDEEFNRLFVPGEPLRYLS